MTPPRDDCPLAAHTLLHTPQESPGTGNPPERELPLHQIPLANKIIHQVSPSKEVASSVHKGRFSTPWLQALENYSEYKITGEKSRKNI